MAKGRFIGKKVSENEDLAEVAEEVGPWGVLLHTWMIPHLDVDGRLNGSPRVIRGRVVPMLPIEAGEVEGILESLVGHGLIRWYRTSEGKRVVEYPAFHANQPGLRKDREAPSRYPGFDPRTCVLLPERPTPGPDGHQEDSGVGPEELRSSEKRGSTGLFDLATGAGDLTYPADVRSSSGVTPPLSTKYEVRSTSTKYQGETEPTLSPDASQGHQPAPAEPRPRLTVTAGGSEDDDELWRDAKERAYHELGLGRLSPEEEQANRLILQQWRYQLRRPRRATDVVAAIRGTDLLRDRGDLWVPGLETIRPDQPVSLKLLVRSDVVLETNEGRVRRRLWGAAIERWEEHIRNEHRTTPARSPEGLTRLRVSL